MTEPETDPSIDGVLHALADNQRRAVLKALVTESEQESVDRTRDRPGEGPLVEVPVERLETAIVSARAKHDAEVPPSSEIAIRLRHVHLPTLEEAGLVTYDSERGRVTYRPDAFVESFLSFLEGRRHSNRIA